MAAIRSLAAITEKWFTVTPQRSGEYEAGVRQPKADWQATSIAANDGWKAGVQAAVAGDLFVKGVRRAGTSAWQEGAVSKGVARWGPGVQLGASKYSAGFAPYQEAIARVTLPPRFARRDPRNLARINAIVNAMIATRQRVAGGGA